MTTHTLPAKRDQEKKERLWRTVELYAKSIIETSRGPLVTLNKHMIVIWTNRSFCEMFRLTPESIVGKDLRELSEGGWNIPELQHILEKILNEKINIEGYQLHHDFSHIGKKSLLINARAITSDLEGDDLILLGVEDVTTKEDTHERLKASEMRYRKLFEAAKDGIMILDAGSGKIVDVNPFLKEMMGYSHDWFMGKELWEIGLFDDIHESQQAFANLQKNGYIRYEGLPLRTLDGRAVSVEFVSNMYLVGETEVIQCNVREITMRKKAEEELKNQLAKDEALLASIGDGIIAPPAAAKMTVFHALGGMGMLTIDNASVSELITPHGTLSTVVTVNGGTLTPKDLTVSVSKTSSPQVNFVGSASTTGLSINAGDAYSVNTPTIAHYKLTRSAGCSGVLTDGGNASCLLTQTFLSGTSTTLKIVTKIINTHGRNSQPADFSTTLIVGTSSAVALPGSESGQVVPVTPNTNYRVSINAGENYTPTSSADCVGKLVEGDTATCEITLSDTALPVFGGEQPNLIPNPGLEVKDNVNPASPMGWVKGADWGVNVASYVYPVSGVSTPDSDIAVGNTASVSYSAYTGDVLTSGDAKWYFSPVAIFAGHKYKYQDSYHTNATTTLVAEFFDSTHAHISLAGFTSVPPSAQNGWKIAGATFAAPAGAAFMTVYHQLNSTGTLTIDNVSLIDETVAAAFVQGFVSLTFDDGYIEHYQTVMPILNAAGQKGTFYIVSHNSGFGITDPSLETKDPTSPEKPLGWMKTETSNAIFRYPVPGHTGVGAEVSASTSDSGASWYHVPSTVLDDQSYQFSHFYKSTGKTQVFIQAKSANGQISYARNDGTLIATKVPYVNLEPASEWAQFKSINIFLPVGTVSVAVMHALSEAGTLTIDDANFGAYTKSLNQTQVLALQSAGHEIGGHTQTHADLNSLSANNASAEITGGRNDLLEGGVTPVLSFAYPYGNNSTDIQRLTKTAPYTSGRGVIDGYNGRDTNRYALFSKSVTADTKTADIETWINKAILEHTWLILTFHQVNDAPLSANSPYATTPKTLQSIVAFIKANNITVRTVAEGASLMEGFTPPPPPATNTPPVIAMHLNVLGNATMSAGVVVVYNVPAVTDDHDTALSALCTPVSGSLFGVGSTTVTCNAKDSGGSAANPTTFVVQVSSVSTSTAVVTPTPTQVFSGGGRRRKLEWWRINISILGMHRAVLKELQPTCKQR